MIKASKDKIFLYMMFFVWPFGTFLYSARNILNKNYHSIILLFAFFYGYSVYVQDGSDAVRYKESYQMICDYDWKDYWYLLTNTYSVDKLNKYEINSVITQSDIYALTLQFFTSRVTNNPRWFWAIVSTIYAFLVLKFLLECAKEVTWVKNYAQKIFFLGLILIVPFYVGVLGVRFWTALFLFMIYALRFIKERKLSYILIASCSILIHFTFVIPIVLLIIAKYISLSRFISYLLILISIAFFSISSVDKSFDIVKTVAVYFDNTNLSNATESYTDLETFENRQIELEQVNWYVKFNNVSILYFLIFLFIVEYSGLLKWEQNAFLKKLEPFYVVSFCITLITFNLGSMGRFCYLFFLSGLLRYSILAGINPDNVFLKISSYVLTPLLILYVLVIARSGFYTIDPLLIVANPVVLLLTQSDLSLSELIVGH